MHGLSCLVLYTPEYYFFLVIIYILVSYADKKMYGGKIDTNLVKKRNEVIIVIIFVFQSSSKCPDIFLFKKTVPLVRDFKMCWIIDPSTKLQVLINSEGDGDFIHAYVSFMKKRKIIFFYHIYVSLLSCKHLVCSKHSFQAWLCFSGKNMSETEEVHHFLGVGEDACYLRRRKVDGHMFFFWRRNKHTRYAEFCLKREGKKFRSRLDSSNNHSSALFIITIIIMITKEQTTWLSESGWAFLFQVFGTLVRSLKTITVSCFFLRHEKCDWADEMIFRRMS